MLEIKRQKKDALRLSSTMPIRTGVDDTLDTLDMLDMLNTGKSDPEYAKKKKILSSAEKTKEFKKELFEGVDESIV